VATLADHERRMANDPFHGRIALLPAAIARSARDDGLRPREHRLAPTQLG
jgi:hypothetical protein